MGSQMFISGWAPSVSAGGWLVSYKHAQIASDRFACIPSNDANCLLTLKFDRSMEITLRLQVSVANITHALSPQAPALCIGNEAPRHRS